MIFWIDSTSIYDTRTFSLIKPQQFQVVVVLDLLKVAIQSEPVRFQNNFEGQKWIQKRLKTLALLMIIHCKDAIFKILQTLASSDFKFTKIFNDFKDNPCSQWWLEQLNPDQVEAIMQHYLQCDAKFVETFTEKIMALYEKRQHITVEQGTPEFHTIEPQPQKQDQQKPQPPTEKPTIKQTTVETPKPTTETPKVKVNQEKQVLNEKPPTPQKINTEKVNEKADRLSTASETSQVLDAILSDQPNQKMLEMAQSLTQKAQQKSLQQQQQQQATTKFKPSPKPLQRMTETSEKKIDLPTRIAKNFNGIPPNANDCEYLTQKEQEDFPLELVDEKMDIVQLYSNLEKQYKVATWWNSFEEKIMKFNDSDSVETFFYENLPVLTKRWAILTGKNFADMSKNPNKRHRTPFQDIKGSLLDYSDPQAAENQQPIIQSSSREEESKEGDPQIIEPPPVTSYQIIDEEQPVVSRVFSPPFNLTPPLDEFDGLFRQESPDSMKSSSINISEQSSLQIDEEKTKNANIKGIVDYYRSSHIENQPENILPELDYMSNTEKMALKLMEQCELDELDLSMQDLVTQTSFSKQFVQFIISMYNILKFICGAKYQVVIYVVKEQNEYLGNMNIKAVSEKKENNKDMKSFMSKSEDVTNVVIRILAIRELNNKMFPEGIKSTTLFEIAISMLKRLMIRNATSTGIIQKILQNHDERKKLREKEQHEKKLQQEKDKEKEKEREKEKEKEKEREKQKEKEREKEKLREKEREKEKEKEKEREKEKQKEREKEKEKEREKQKIKEKEKEKQKEVDNKVKDSLKEKDKNKDKIQEKEKKSDTEKVTKKKPSGEEKKNEDPLAQIRAEKLAKDQLLQQTRKQEEEIFNKQCLKRIGKIQEKERQIPIEMLNQMKKVIAIEDGEIEQLAKPIELRQIQPPNYQQSQTTNQFQKPKQQQQQYQQQQQQQQQKKQQSQSQYVVPLVNMANKLDEPSFDQQESLEEYNEYIHQQTKPQPQQKPFQQQQYKNQKKQKQKEFKFQNKQQMVYNNPQYHPPNEGYQEYQQHQQGYNEGYYQPKFRQNYQCQQQYYPQYEPRKQPRIDYQYIMPPQPPPPPPQQDYELKSILMELKDFLIARK